MPRWLIATVLMGCGHINVDLLVADGSNSPDDGGVAVDVPSTQGWRLVQTQASPFGDSSFRVARLGSQNLIVVAAQIAPFGTISGITDTSNCNSYLPIPAAHAFCNISELHMFYAAGSCAGADRISVDSTEILAGVMWEVSGIRSQDPVDTAVVLTEQAETTAPLGPRITTSTDGEFVVSVALVDNTISGIHPGNEFTNDQTALDNGWAHLTDPKAKAGVHQAQWDQPTAGAYCAAAVAFKVAP
jgi:hypothetical protein